MPTILIPKWQNMRFRNNLRSEYHTMKQQFIATVLLVLISFDISNSAKSTFFGQGTNEFVPNTRVLTIDHYSQEDALQDSHVRDQTWAQRYYRIRTPLKTGSKVGPSNYFWHLCFWSWSTLNWKRFIGIEGFWEDFGTFKRVV